MNIIETLYENKICGIAPLTLINMLENKDAIKTKKPLIIMEHGRMKSVKCICDVYSLNGVKQKSSLSNNACFAITNKFGIENGFEYSCANCHLYMAKNLIVGKSSLLQKKR